MTLSSRWWPTTSCSGGWLWESVALSVSPTMSRACPWKSSRSAWLTGTPQSWTRCATTARISKAHRVTCTQKCNKQPASLSTFVFARMIQKCFKSSKLSGNERGVMRFHVLHSIIFFAALLTCTGQNCTSFSLDQSNISTKQSWTTNRTSRQTSQRTSTLHGPKIIVCA